jgi:Chaperone of endosialidase
MATPLLGLALPTTGSLPGAWGNTVNDSITSLLDSAIAGTTTLSADSDVTLTNNVEAADQSRQAIIRWTATGTVTRNITAPTRSKTYIVINTSSTQAIVLKASGTTGVTILPGERCVAAWNGSDFTKVSMYVAVTPEQFGAKGDGSTDDRVALQAAFDSGFDVVLSTGRTYFYTGASLKITTNNQKVSGGGVLKPSGAISGVTIGAESATVAGSFVVGKTYVITSIGSTDFTLIGAAANTVGVTFVATGVGTGSGQAWLTTFGNEVSLTFNSSVQTAGSYALYIGNGNRVKVSKLHIYDAGAGLYVTKSNTVSVEWMWATVRGAGITWYGNSTQRSDILNLVFAIVSPGASTYGMDWDGNCHSLTAKYLGIVGGAGGGKGMIIRNTSGATVPAIGRFGQIEVDYPYSHGIEIAAGLDYDFDMPYVLGAGTWPTYLLAAQDGIKIAAGINDYEVRISGGKSVGNTGYGINALGGIIYLAGNTALYTNTLGPYNSLNNIQNRVPRYSVDDGYYLALSSGNPLLTFNPNSYLAYDRTNKALNVQIANAGGSAAVGAATFTNTYVQSLLPLYVGTAGSSSGVLRLYSSTAGYVGLTVPATSSSTTYVWPSSPINGNFLQTDSSGNLTWAAASGGSGVATVSVASSNGFTGSSSGGTNPILTLATSVTGILKGNGTSVAAAVAGTDYLAPGSVVTSVGGTGTVSGLTLTGTVTSTGNLTLGGAITGTGSGSVVLATSPTITTPVISGNTTVNGLALGNGISSGTNNTVFGLGAYSSATSGASNVAIGASAFNSATTASQSTIVGRGAGTGITTQSSNTCIGYFTAIGTIGTSNTAVGSIALSGTTGTGAAFNTAIGYSALDTLTTYQNSSGIGYNAQVTGSNQIQLGDASTTTYVYGTVQNRSDLRDKADVRDTQLGLSFVNALRPVDYKLDMRDDYKPARPDDVENAEAMAAWREASKIENLTHDGSKKRSRFHHGLIAQEVKAVLDAQGIDFGGFQDHKIAGGNDVLTIGYDELIAPLIKAIQELTARVQELESK